MFLNLKVLTGFIIALGRDRFRHVAICGILLFFFGLLKAWLGFLNWKMFTCSWSTRRNCGLEISTWKSWNATTHSWRVKCFHHCTEPIIRQHNKIINHVASILSFFNSVGSFYWGWSSQIIQEYTLQRSSKNSMAECSKLVFGFSFIHIVREDWGLGRFWVDFLHKSNYFLLRSHFHQIILHYSKARGIRNQRYQRWDVKEDKWFLNKFLTPCYTLTPKLIHRDLQSYTKLRLK